MAQNAQEIKEKILRFMRTRGPSLPVHVAKEINMSILFASAFLSELLSERQVKLSHMRVGTTPLYLIPGHEPQIEKFGLEHLKGKEKEAFLLLKENKFLSDADQQPAIRVALRAIKDFAIPFQKQEKIFWRYFTIPEDEFNISTNEPKQQTTSEQKFPTIEQQTATAELQIKESPHQLTDSSPGESPTKSEFEPSMSNEVNKPLNIFNKTEKNEIKEKPKKKTAKKITQKKSSPPQKAQEKFFNRVKEFIAEKQAEISEIISAGKSELILKIKTEGKEKILVAFNKKKISEKEIIQAHKKSKEYELPYLVMSLGEMPKKVNELIEALKTLADIEKIE